MADSTDITWRRSDAAWSERATIRQDSHGLTITGNITSEGGSGWFQPAFAARYLVGIANDWSSTHLHVTAESDDLPGLGPLVLTRRGRAGWFSGEQALPSLDQATDVDLFLTPATNTIPLRRLDLEVGESTTIVAVLVSIEPSPATWSLDLSCQRYERLAADTYRFATMDSADEIAFSADLTVRAGVVRRYGDHWTAV